jgi:hypothetical protein
MFSSLPKKFGLAGIAIGLIFILLWWFDLTYNPFGLPGLGNSPANYVEPLTRTIAERLMFVLCPGLLLQVFSIGVGSWFAWAMWILAASLNGPIYYLLGWIVAHILRMRSAKIAAR